MTGQGGWPMTVFLTPDGQPFYGGTYFPDTPRHGMPSFRQVLEGVRPRLARAARRGRARRARRLVEALVEQQRAGSAPRATCRPPGVLDAAAAALDAAFDPVNGGWGRAPKFPQPMTIEFLLRRHVGRRATRGRCEIARRSARRDGRRRHPRPARRRLPPLRDRRALAGAALRADALRQRAARARLPARVGAHGRRRATSTTATGTLDYLLRELRDAPTAASRPARTPTPRARRARPSSGRAAEIREVLGADAAAVRGGLRRDRRAATGRAARSCRGSATTRSWRSGSGSRRSEVARAAGRGPGAAAGAARRRGPSRPATTRCWRPGTGWRSRALADAARALGAAGDPALAAAADRYREAAATAAGAVARRAAGRGRAPAALVEGRPGDGRRRARGLREPRRGAARAVRGDVRRALVHDGRARSWTSILARFADPAGGFFDTADDGEPLVVRPRDLAGQRDPVRRARWRRTVLLRLRR